jgi:hypothetical protein
MTSRLSSISSSEARRYLAVFAVGTLLLVAALVAVTGFGYSRGLVDASNRNVYDYQAEKLEKTPKIDIAFVGDSSLGNAIDASLFSELSGAAAVNLSLSGTYGLGASYNMIRRALEQHKLRVAVVMQALKTMTRREAAAGYFFTTDHPDLSELSPIEIAEVYLSYRAANETVEQIRRNGWSRVATAMIGDYVPQMPRKDRLSTEQEVVQDPLLPGMISKEQLHFIEKIAEMCRAEGITCLYAHGPIYDGYCQTSGAYIARLDEAIRRAGLTVVDGTPLCMPLADVGDRVDHVLPDLKAVYTRRYYALLAPYLAGQISVADTSPTQSRSRPRGSDRRQPGDGGSQLRDVAVLHPDDLVGHGHPGRLVGD